MWCDFMRSVWRPQPPYVCRVSGHHNHHNHFYRYHFHHYHYTISDNLIFKQSMHNLGVLQLIHASRCRTAGVLQRMVVLTTVSSV